MFLSFLHIQVTPLFFNMIKILQLGFNCILPTRFLWI